MIQLLVYFNMLVVDLAYKIIIFQTCFFKSLFDILILSTYF